MEHRTGLLLRTFIGKRTMEQGAARTGMKRDFAPDGAVVNVIVGVGWRRVIIPAGWEPEQGKAGRPGWWLTVGWVGRGFV
jgi:hypothetical protein